jgi:hypothetical protein
MTSRAELGTTVQMISSGVLWCGLTGAGTPGRRRYLIVQ